MIDGILLKRRWRDLWTVRLGRVRPAAATAVVPIRWNGEPVSDFCHTNLAGKWSLFEWFQSEGITRRLWHISIWNWKSGWRSFAGQRGGTRDRSQLDWQLSDQRQLRTLLAERRIHGFCGTQNFGTNCWRSGAQFRCFAWFEVSEGCSWTDGCHQPVDQPDS